MSVFNSPGPSRMLRPELPNTPDATAWNAVLSNHESTVCAPWPSPTRLGRPVIRLPTELLLCVTVNGRPVRGDDAAEVEAVGQIQNPVGGDAVPRILIRRPFPRIAIPSVLQEAR